MGSHRQRKPTLPPVSHINDMSRRWLKKKYPELYRVYIRKLRMGCRPRILIGTSGLPYLTHDFEFALGRTYTSLIPPEPVTDERELAAFFA